MDAGGASFTSYLGYPTTSGVGGGGASKREIKREIVLGGGVVHVEELSLVMVL